MKIQTLTRRSLAITVGALVLLGGGLAAAQAQDAGTTATTEPTKAISLNLVNVPVQAALRTLFSSAGIRNYSIKSDVQGFANINVSEVPFNLALRQLLGSVNPPLTYTVTDGTYIVSVLQATPPPPVATIGPINPGGIGDDPGNPTSGLGDQPKRFYRIPIDKYDAYVIAQLLEKTSGIIQVPVNVVIPSAGGPGGGGGQGGNGQGGFGSGSQFGQGFGSGSGLSAPVTSVGGGYGSGTYGGGGYGGSNGRFGGSTGGTFGGGGGTFGGGGGTFGGVRPFGIVSPAK